MFSSELVVNVSLCDVTMDMNYHSLLLVSFLPNDLEA